MNPDCRKYQTLLATVFAAAIIARAQAPAPKITIHLDPQKTEIRWTLHDVLHTVRGTFRLKGGLMTFDPATGAAQGEFVVDTVTGESGNRIRDEKMQKEVLESAKYPLAFFHPVKFSGSLKAGSTQNLTVEGTLNVHGTDHPLTLQMAAQLNGTDATATTQFGVPYVAWGMKDESTFLLKVDKEVTIDVVARGTVEGLSPAK
ncbi:YceI family protein [Alloacidobacterium sp.]|uniref:YceI family protein n=1 Tax=Alloacidobacterium sp. TaxID=2951999 RepID=UPI002D5D869A|nr:YceI family protein [Alloacidobacterium sp.]HYK38093.1 YceI family protein [Alloacidobacterium sp.]